MILCLRWVRESQKRAVMNFLRNYFKEVRGRKGTDLEKSAFWVAGARRGIKKNICLNPTHLILVGNGRYIGTQAFKCLIQ